MKVSKKYSKKIKKHVLQVLGSTAVVAMIVATSTVANFSIPLKLNNLFKNQNVELTSVLNENDVSISENADNLQTFANNSSSPVTIADDGAIICDSIVQGVRDCDLEDGNYVFRVKTANETKDYAIELINYADDVTYSLDDGQTSKVVSLGDTTTNYRMLVAKYHKNLTIDKGVTVTATNVSGLTYKKGMYICVMGKLENNGTISMTARGTYNVAGENVYLWKNADGSYEYVPASGAAGLGARPTGSGRRQGYKGNNGINRATGGGGQGSSITNGNNGSGSSYVGASTGGTSYGGGNASGGVVRCNCSALGASYTQASAVRGGNGYAYDDNSDSSYFAGAGAGVTGGSTSYNRISSSGTQTAGGTGVGGLLIVYSNDLKNDGEIASKGSNGAGGTYSFGKRYNGAVGGGGSGGGSVNIFYNKTSNVGSVVANGGAGGNVQGCRNAGMGLLNGGAGGDGSVTVTNLQADLNYPVKEITLRIGETYQIDKNLVQLVNQNSTQQNSVVLGNIDYEILNSSVASFQTSGIITGVSKGVTKLHITDKTNNLETYIYVNVIDAPETRLSTGNEFTVALKENGTVWTFGKNNVGQLGNGDNTNSNKPVQVMFGNADTPLENITQIASGDSHSIALAKDGTIYTWGNNVNGQLGNGTNNNSNVAVKVDGLSNIVKVDAYENFSIALDSEGKVYVWGKDYSILPMRLITPNKMSDISGTLLLGQNGNIYNISDLDNPIKGLSRIAKISAGVDHYLALTTNGYVYSWGANNSYGELGRTSSSITAQIAKDVVDISAGNDTSIVINENNEAYICGTNANGRIGLGSTAYSTTMTKIDIGKDIELISHGKGAHTVISDFDGFVYTTGLNSSGQLGNGNNTSLSTFTKIGETTIEADEMVYMDLGEVKELEYKLINTFNLKIDTVDSQKESFTVAIPDSTKLQLNDYNVVTALDYSLNDVVITHNPTGITKKITIKVIKKMDEIIRGIRDCTLTDGAYEILVNGEIYKIELYNYYDDMTYSLDSGEESKIVKLGNDTPDDTMLVVKYHKNLTIEAGVTLTPTVRKKGMYVCVLGDIVNNGEITMTAKGANVSEGQNVFLWENIDNSYEYVPADGAEGLQPYKPGCSWSGRKGNDGTDRGTGSGGQSGAIINRLSGSAGSYVGASTGGNSYAGGNASGAVVRCNSSALPASYTQATHLAGGNGNAYDANPPTQYFAGGGAGLTGGNSSYAKWGTANTQTKAQDGVGGLLMLYADTLNNKGRITSEGSQGAGGNFAFNNRYNGAVGGAGSGGGSINIFARIVSDYGDVSSAGGKGGKIVASRANMGAINGPDGGDGVTTITELGSRLNYPVKQITLSVPETYLINENDLYYVKLNDIQTEDLTVGNLVYEVEDSSIATVDQNGNIVSCKLGKTKVKITDTTNGYSTYIIVNVREAGLVEPEIKEGTDFTVALKANGTVWAYGKNTNGQLGNNSTDNSNEPIKVVGSDYEGLSNIIHIGAGDSAAIAVNDKGEVFTWGKGLDETVADDEQGTVTKIDRLVAKKVDGLADIIQVDCFGNNFYAVDKFGKVYIWGDGYVAPTAVATNVGIIDVEGDLLLGEDGKVYTIKEPTKAIEHISNAVELARGVDHYLYLTQDGRVYTLDAGGSGQLGNGQNVDRKLPGLVDIDLNNTPLENVTHISAGDRASMAVTSDGKVYVFGDNSNKKLGIENKNVNYAVQVLNLQDVTGNPLTLQKMEIVEVGLNHASISDEYGYVYSVGLNKDGQLGLGDNDNRSIFTKILGSKIMTVPDIVRVPVNTVKDISIIKGNAFNIKSDITAKGDVEVLDTNTKVADVSKILGVDNKDVVDIAKLKPNFKVTGNKIGRLCLVATDEDGVQENVWITVTNNEDAKVAAKVEVGNGFTVTLRSDGTVWGFGNLPSGQVNEPQKIELPEPIIDISCGEGHTLLLGISGKVYSLGLNSKGQLGTGNTSTYKKPIDLGLNNIEKVVANGNTSFAISNSGKVYAWGDGYTKKPEMLNIEHNVIDVTKGYYLSDDGVVRKLSDNLEILLSLNEYDPALTPVVIDERIMQISEGTNHVILLGESGKVYSYGDNTYGQLGDGTTNSRKESISTVVRIEDGSVLKNVAEIAAGDRYNIVVTADGKVYSFGINGNEQLGFSNVLEEGGIIESSYARLKTDISDVERVSAGYTHTAVYKEDGNAYTWGQGKSGQLGNGDYLDYSEAQLVGKNIIQTNVVELLLEVGDTFDIDSKINYFNLFEDKNAQLTYEILDSNMAFVDNLTGELMTIAEGRTTVIVKEVGTGKKAVIPLRILAKGTKPDSMNMLIEPQVETSGSHTIMLKVDGSVWCYGNGENGELGTGKQEISDEPVQAIFPTGTIITKIAAGESHCLALDSKGNVWSWGKNTYYQLGNTNTNNILTPTKVSGLENIRDIACGINNSFAIGKSGEVFSFGLNANGEGGIGSYTNKIPVTRAKNVTDAIDIKAGKNHTIILKSNGEVFVTGSNLYGELGNNTSDKKINKFTKVDSLNEVVAIATGDSNNMVIRTDGSVYVWGSNVYKELGAGSMSTSVVVPTKVSGLKNIRYIDGGKGYITAINNSNEVFVNGLNTSGELGNSTKNNSNTFSMLTTIQDVMQISSGNAYTVMVKTDGTVWGCGDYTHGNEDIKSKTKSSIPVQVGNDETGLGETEITLAVGENKEVAADCAYAFNLIVLDDNFADSLDFESLNIDIATVNDTGMVTGQKVGKTRVNAVSKVDGKVYSVIVNVVKKAKQVAPRVESGEDFAAVLKADGTLWTFGYNSDGRLGNGKNLTKDVPTRTNVLATYLDIKAGKDFLLALRNDGSVWAVGNNKLGQLGDKTTTNKNKLVQIQGLSNIKQIDAGDNYGIAVDDLGIVYVWGYNSNGAIGNDSIGSSIMTPKMLTTSGQRIVSIAAGKSQSAFVTAKGEVFGYGNILNGTISGIGNAIKVQVTDNSIIILTVDNKVYEYKVGSLTQISIAEKVIDISANHGNVMYQTSDEKTYVSGDNIYGALGVGDTNPVISPVLVNKHGMDTFGIGAGIHNTYIIENTGNVYASGNNQYGSIGNGTRNNEVEHILVGDRNFKIEPETATMKVGDVEQVKITGEPFNVFDDIELSKDEYEWENDNELAVTVVPGTITAIGEGTAHITVTDKVTGEKITVTRIIVDQEKDRIANISVNNIVATVDETSTEDDIKYKVQVVTNDNKGVLKVTTNNLTDRISIDGGATWSYNGTFNGEIELTDKFTTVNITVGVQNNEGDYPTEITYTLTVEKITDDVGIKEITVTENDDQGNTNTIKATPVSLTKYEVVVDENTEISLADVIANSQYSFVSIDGLDYELKEQTKNITLGSDLTKEVKIAVKSEAGTEAEYTLVIYKKSEIMNMLHLEVNDKEATKISEATYAAKVPKNTNLAKVLASVESNLVSISIANNDYDVKTSTRNVSINSDTTVVSIKVKLDDEVKEYTLYIYREDDEEEIEPSLKLDMLLVNGTVVMPEADKITYIAYLPSTTEDAVIRAIAKDNTTIVKIADNTADVGDSQQIVATPDTENTYVVTLTDTEGNSKDYTVIIRKAETDASLDRVYISKNGTDTEAVKQDDGTYLVKVPGSYTDVDVTAITGYIKAKAQVANSGIYKINIDTRNVSLTGDTTPVSIKVQSEDGTQEKEYILNIVKMSNNADLLTVEVDGDIAQLGDDGKYHYILQDAKNSVSVKAITDDELAYVKFDNTSYALHEIEKQEIIASKQTEVPIKVKAEDGTIKDYMLVIEGLPDDTTILKVVVDGEQAKYIEGENRYEIRSNNTEYEIEVTLNDLLASMELGTNPKAIGIDTIRVTKTGTTTEVKVVVTAQNGIDTEEYTIVISEKSSNNNLDILKVNGNIIYPDINGNYKASIKEIDTLINIEAIAEDEYATTTIDGNSNNSYIANITENVINGVKVYNYVIKVVAEDGSEAEYLLEVTQLEGNTNILDVLVGKEETDLSQATLEADGKYHYKIDNVEEAFVSVNLESEKSMVTINGKSDKIVNVELPTEQTIVKIQVIAEDGTIKDIDLVIDKKSSDTSIKSITGEGVVKTEINDVSAIVYVDEDLGTTDLTITLNNKLGSLKLLDETEYTLSEIVRTVDTSSVTELYLDILAEDGTEKGMVVNIIRIPNLNISSVTVNSDNVPYDESLERFDKVVPNGNKPVIVITADNPAQTVQLLNEAGTVIATGVGSVTTTQNLPTTDLTTKYKIKIISHNGVDAGYEEKDLWIRQKSTETGIMYVKVDNLGTVLSSDGLTYSATVSGKEEYPVEIKLKDSNAQVRIQDLEGNILIDNQTGVLVGSLPVADGETKQFKMIVTSENGEVKEYNLVIERISSNLNLEEITVTDIDDEGNIVTRIVSDYNPNTKVYKILVKESLTNSDISIKAESIFTDVDADHMYTGKGNVTFNKVLDESGTTVITMYLTAADGTTDVRYLHIIQLSEDIRIQTVYVDGVIIAPNDAGDYETTVTDEIDLAGVRVDLVSETSKVSINNNTPTLNTNQADISKGGNRQVIVPIDVVAEDGSSYRYYLTLNIISHDASVQKVEVDNEEAKFIDDKYVAYIDKYGVEANIDITANSIYSTVEHEMEDGTIVSNKHTLSFKLDTSDLDMQEFDTIFKVIAEDGTEKEYIVHCIRKSDDNTIHDVFVNDIELEPNSGKPGYDDGTYYIAVTGDTAKVKVNANNEFATVSFNGKSGIQTLEQVITLDTSKKITEVPVTITSQQGTTYDTVIYIEKISDNNKLLSVKVDSKEAEDTDVTNEKLAYIYDTQTQARVVIETEHSEAMIIRTNSDGTPWVDEFGVKCEAKNLLDINVLTPDDEIDVYFKVVAESGLESPVYTLRIVKMSSDATLKEVYVDGVLIERDENGKYTTTILDTVSNVDIKAVTNHELANVRIALGNESLHIAEQTVAISGNRQTIIPITVRSQSGITKVEYIYINKISTSVRLETVTLDGKVASYYNEDTHTYRFLIDNDKEDYELFVLAESDYTVLEFEGTDYQASFTSIVNIALDAQGKTLKVKAKSESGIEQEYTIEIVRKSNNTELDFLKVNDIERQPDVPGGDIYTVIIPKLATSTLIEVQSSHPYANVRLGDNTVKLQHDIASIDCSDLTQNTIVVPIVVTAADGETIRTYNVYLVRGSNDTDIELEVNDVVINADNDGNYSVEFLENKDDIKIKATALNEGVEGDFASIDINNTGILETPSKEIILTKEEVEGKAKIEVPVQVVAEDGTIRNSILTIWFKQGTYISGKILTENVNGEYISTVTIYDSDDIRPEDLENINNADGSVNENVRQPIATVQTELDGTFKILMYMKDEKNTDDNDGNGIPDILESKYDVVVTKNGYLEYRVTAVGIKDRKETVLDEHKILAGDVVKSGQIEIDDIVTLNDNYGVNITNDNKQSVGHLDLNEDGIIDDLDRDILLGNYGKKSESIQWVDPELSAEPEIVAYMMNSDVDGQEEFILPIKCEYTITSEYGTRIHPVTKEVKKHTGIDLGASVHHTEVYAVADGEVTFAGVQNGFGNCVEIKHVVNGETVYSFYAHLSRIDVVAGQKVAKGDVIALEGGDPKTDPNPGSSTGHHLHFEMRSASGYGNDINPGEYIEF